MIRKFFHFLYVLYALILFIALMIPVFIWALAVLPFGRFKTGNLIFHGCRVWARIWLTLVFIRHKNMYESKPRLDESYIYVSNHISYLDSALVPEIFRKPVRPLGKVEMARIPIFGFIYRNTIVTVDRSSAYNREKSVQQLKNFLKRGISILVFPEGTFNESHQPLLDFYSGAFRIAIETGYPIRPVLILDSYSRMNYRTIFSLNPGRSRAVFLDPIDPAGLTLEQLDELKDKVYAVMKEKLIEYQAPWIAAP